MPFTLEKIEKNQAVLTIDVPEEEVRAALEAASRRLAARVSIPGFRRGKAPRAIVERHVGRSKLTDDALNELIARSYVQAVRESGLDLLALLKTEVDQFEDSKPLKYRATVQLRPDVELGDYASAREQVERQKVEVTEEELDRELELLRERQGRLVAEESGSVAKGHWAVIDFEGRVGERAYPERKVEGLLLEVGAGRLPPGVEEGMVGMAPGETKEIKVLLPPDYPGEGLAGQEAVFTVALRELKRRELPALDDAFAASLGPSTLKELREDLKNRLLILKERAERRRFEAAVAEKVVEGAVLEVPESLVERAGARMWDRWLEDLKNRGLTLEGYLAATGQAEETVRAEFRERATAGVRKDLVLDAVAAREKIQVSDAELQIEAARVLQAYDRREDIRSLLERPDTQRRLREDLMESKTVALLAYGSALDLSRPREAEAAPAAGLEGGPPGEDVAPAPPEAPREAAGEVPATAGGAPATAAEAVGGGAPEGAPEAAAETEAVDGGGAEATGGAAAEEGGKP